MARLLFGPCDDPIFFDRFLHTPVAEGRWAVFNSQTPSWEAAIQPLGGALPEAVIVWPGYTSVPSWVWSVPVPLIAAAHDPNLLWHNYRHLLPLADLVLTDAPSTDRLRRAGITHVRAANLFGLDRHFAAAIDEPEVERDLDVVFVGNINPAIQGQRLPWLARLGMLADRHTIAIAAGVFGAEYRALLRRAKLVFNRSIRGECNLRALEAAASGAVLLQEAENQEVQDYLQPGVEYAPYTREDFESVVERLLASTEQRHAIAKAAKERVRGLTFETLIRVGLGVGGKDWSEILERARERIHRTTTLSLAGRVWQRASRVGPDTDANLPSELATAENHHALGVLKRSKTEAESHLAVAAQSGNRVSAVGQAVILAEHGPSPNAIALLRTVITALENEPTLTPVEADSVPYPVRFDGLRAEWERVGYENPDNPLAERQEKAKRLRGRAQALLAELSGELSDYQAAITCCPLWPHLHTALGLAQLRAGQRSQAVDTLRAAVEHNPFDNVAARALAETLVFTEQRKEAEHFCAQRQLLAKAAPQLVTRIALPATLPSSTPSPSVEVKHEPSSAAPAQGDPKPAPESSTASQPLTTAVNPTPTTERKHPQTRFVALSRDAFIARFGNPDTSRALSGFTPPVDTHAVLTLLAHFQPRRILEIGTAAGHMTANLTAFTPPDAIVYSLGIVAEDQPQSGTAHQNSEVPRRDQFAQFLNYFGTAHKAMLITADSRRYDFTRLAPLDFAFIDGGHDLATARSDSVAAYQTLRPGGRLVWHDVPSSVSWVEVEQAIAQLTFPESVYKVAGTQVAFLIKGEGVGAAASADSGVVAVTWDGAVDALHSLAHVNRSVCEELVARGNTVALAAQPHGGVPATPLPVPPELVPCRGLDLPTSVHVRHRWPPDFTPPTGTGPLVLIQPWEFGRIPRSWVESILNTVDEVWAYSRSVLRAFVASGVPESRLAIVPPGVDLERFRPGCPPLPLATTKSVKLLFIGGTIPRKGFDILLAAYRRAFHRTDDVCLVVKDMGVGSFYRGQTAEEAIRTFQNDPTAPEIVYRADDLGEDELPQLYAACDVLVHSYRGEGFGLPVLEAMACGLPVVVTAGGPTDEFVPQSAGWRIPARLRYFEREAVGDAPTVGKPWWLEPDPDALVAILQEVVANTNERKRRGEAGRRAALGWSWARTAVTVEDRVRVLRTRTPVRLQRRLLATPPPPVPARAETLAAPPVFAQAITIRSDEPLIVSAAAPSQSRVTVPAVVGQPRVSLTMIVKNEEKNLPECLASVRDLVDEAVVIDTGSSDRTREIAAHFGCVVGEFPWIDHFAAARNAALEKATGDYAFWMDADDRLDLDNRTKLQTLLRSLPASNAAFVMKCLCVGEMTGTAGTAVDHVRLFRLHSAHRWTYRVHEQILPSLRTTGADVQWSEVCIRHVGYIDPTVRRRKLERDLRLLKLDETDKPNDPFTLFNLGSIYHEIGDYLTAATVLEKSLAGSHIKDSIVRKTYALLSRCQHQSGNRRQAEATCRNGRQHYPDDAELLFLSAGFAREGNDPGAAEDLYRKLIDGSEGPHFASVDTSLRAVKGRHNLAVLLLDQTRLSEAEGVWRAALTHDPHFYPAQVGLGEIYVRARNQAGLDRQVAALEALGDAGAAEAATLSARWHSAHGNHPAAVATLEAAIAKLPRVLGLRVALSHTHIAADSPPEALESSFRGVLELDPSNTQAQRNLEVLYRKTGRWVEGVVDGTEPTSPA